MTELPPHVPLVNVHAVSDRHRTRNARAVMHIDASPVLQLYCDKRNTKENTNVGRHKGQR
jgi:hypothetical protein